jgi:hypothetical protein
MQSFPDFRSTSFRVQRMPEEARILLSHHIQGHHISSTCTAGEDDGESRRGGGNRGSWLTRYTCLITFKSITFPQHILLVKIMAERREVVESMADGLEDILASSSYLN